jgi:glucokinase
MSGNGYGIGVDVGGTNVKLAVATRAGEILDRQTFATTDWAGGVRDAISAVEAARGPAETIGVAAPGIAARDHSSIWWMYGHMAGLVDFNWAKHLSRDGPVPVLNDAHAALLGEHWIGAARGICNVAMLTLGTGVGGAVICDGQLLQGHLGRAGHLGHVVVDVSESRDAVNTPGSLEYLIGEYNLPQRSGGRFKTTRELLEAQRSGDGDAYHVWFTSIRALAASLAGIINVVDPEIIILGGGIAGAGDDLFVPLRNLLQVFEWRPRGREVRIVPAMLGDGAGALGAARFAMNQENV